MNNYICTYVYNNSYLVIKEVKAPTFSMVTLLLKLI